MRTTSPCLRPLPSANRAPAPLRRPDPDLAPLAREPWVLRVAGQSMLVRPGTPRDLAGVARMHTRCTARSLLDRYRNGGRAPAVLALDVMLRGETSVVVVAPDNEIIASAVLQPDGAHVGACVELGLLVEDDWQQRGIGSELITHLAGVAHAAGYLELITYPATAMDVAQQLMVGVGRTRLVPDVEAHLHTFLPESAGLGLGAVRQRLAG